jgi:hypothetical protein
VNPLALSVVAGGAVVLVACLIVRIVRNRRVPDGQRVPVARHRPYPAIGIGTSRFGWPRRNRVKIDPDAHVVPGVIPFAPRIPGDLPPGPAAPSTEPPRPVVSTELVEEQIEASTWTIRRPHGSTAAGLPQMMPGAGMEPHRAGHMLDPRPLPIVPITRTPGPALTDKSLSEIIAIYGRHERQVEGERWVYPDLIPAERLTQDDVEALITAVEPRPFLREYLNKIPPREPRAVETSEYCPRCESPSPRLHPSVQPEGGEVQPCPHPWHGPRHSQAVHIYDDTEDGDQ